MDRSIEVEIGDKTYTMELTIDALQRINKRHGSFRECAQRIALFDLGVIWDVIVIGADLSDKQAQKMREASASIGVANLAQKAADYIQLCLNPNPDEEADESGEA